MGEWTPNVPIKILTSLWSYKNKLSAQRASFCKWQAGLHLLHMQSCHVYCSSESGVPGKHGSHVVNERHGSRFQKGESRFVFVMDGWMINGWMDGWMASLPPPLPPSFHSQTMKHHRHFNYAPGENDSWRPLKNRWRRKRWRRGEEKDREEVGWEERDKENGRIRWEQECHRARKQRGRGGRGGEVISVFSREPQVR